MILFQVKEWQSLASGLYYCSCVDDLAHGSGDWWLIARAMNLAPAAFLELLVKEYKPDVIKYNKDTNFLYYAWTNYENCHRFKLNINKAARRNGFMI